MADLNVDYLKLKAIILLLKDMKSDWKDYKLEVPEPLGKGKSYEIIQDMVEEYEGMYDAMVGILDKTIEFIENASKEIKLFEEETVKTIGQGE